MLVTIYADNDGYVEGSNATYATARTTAATAYEDMAPAVGQQLSGGTYKCFESFLSFPLSSLGDYGADEYELLSASIFLQVSADAHSGPGQQTALRISRRVGKIARLVDVFNRDQTFDHPVFVHQR